MLRIPSLSIAEPPTALLLSIAIFAILLIRQITSPVKQDEVDLPPAIFFLLGIFFWFMLFLYLI